MADHKDAVGREDGEVLACSSPLPEHCVAYCRTLRGDGGTSTSARWQTAIHRLTDGAGCTADSNQLHGQYVELQACSTPSMEQLPHCLCSLLMLLLLCPACMSQLLVLSRQSRQSRVAFRVWPDPTATSLEQLSNFHLLLCSARNLPTLAH